MPRPGGCQPDQTTNRAESENPRRKKGRRNKICRARHAHSEPEPVQKPRVKLWGRERRPLAPLGEGTTFSKQSNLTNQDRRSKTGTGDLPSGPSPKFPYHSGTVPPNHSYNSTFIRAEKKR